MREWLRLLKSIGFFEYLIKKRYKFFASCFLILSIAGFEIYILLNIDEIFSFAEFNNNFSSYFLLLSVLILNGIFKILQIYFTHGLIYNFGGYLSRNEFNSLLSLEVSKIRNLQSSELLKKFDLINLITINALNPVAMFIFNFAILISLLIGIIIINPLAAIVGVFVVTIFYTCTMLVISPSLRNNSLKQSQIISQKLAYIRELQTAASEIFLSPQRGNIKQNYNKIESSLRKIQTWNLIFSASPRFIFETILILLLISFIILSNLDSGTLLQSLIPFGYAAYRILPMTQALYSNWSNLKAHISMISEIEQSIEQQESSDSEDTRFEIVERALRSDTSSRVSMTIKNLDLKLHDKIIFFLKDQTFYSGNVWFLKGESGSGKSTFVDILCKYIRCKADIDLSVGIKTVDYDDPEWRYSIAVATQKGSILKMSIRDNLNFFSSEGHDDATLLDIIDKLNLSQLVSKKDDLDIILTEDANNISGGQRQRLSIARVLLSDRPILIFDESSSNLDNMNRIIVEELIEQKSKTALCFVVSHVEGGFPNSHKLVFDQKNKNSQFPLVKMSRSENDMEEK